MAVSDSGLDARVIAARLERLPQCSWHLKMRLSLGTAYFFEAFDILSIAFVLPVLFGLWHLTPGEAGTLLSIAFAGQFFGSIAAGWFADRIGRSPVVIATLLIFTLGTLACAFAWDYGSMLTFRFVQGIGLGGEIPIMASYVSEFAKAKGRGFFSISVGILFSFGTPAVALAGVWVVPHWGWQWMFYIGAIPALLALPMRAMLVESPRWLASRGRLAEADSVLAHIETIAQREGKALPPLPADLPPVVAASARLGDLFRGIYLKRTVVVWILWVISYMIAYAMLTWAPSLFRTVYKLPVQQSLNYGLILNVGALAGALIFLFAVDRVGRKPLFIGGSILGTVPLLAFGVGGDKSAETVIALITASYFFRVWLSVGLTLYTVEIYPNQLRGLGAGIAGAWQRAASFLGPLVVGAILPVWGLDAVFVTFGVMGVVGLIACFFMVETRGKVLEELSPALVPAEEEPVARRQSWAG